MNSRIISILFCIVSVTISCGKNNLSQTQFINEVNRLTQLHNGYIPDKAIDKLFLTIEENPQTIDFQIDKSDFETIALIITTSQDGSMRTYSVERGGFMGNPALGCNARTLLQYRDDNSIKCIELENVIGYIAKIVRVDTLKHRYILLDYEQAICQGDHFYMKLMGVEITDSGEIVPVKIFKEAGHLYSHIDLNWEGYGYDEASDKVKTSVELFDYQCMYYDESIGELSIPHIIEYYGYPIATEAWHCYQWDGRYFVDKGVAPLFDLYCGDFHIIIDISQDGNYRYRCWNKNRQVSDKPDLQIDSGIKLYWDECGTKMVYKNAYDILPIGYIYTFYNKNYRYEYHTGWYRGRNVDELLIYRDSNELIYRHDCTHAPDDCN